MKFKRNQRLFQEKMDIPKILKKKYFIEKAW